MRVRDHEARASESSVEKEARPERMQVHASETRALEDTEHEHRLEHMRVHASASRALIVGLKGIAI